MPTTNMSNRYGPLGEFKNMNHNAEWYMNDAPGILKK